MAVTEITATYHVTTRMFCAGAVQELAELRPASFKGMLRFYFRAIAWAEYRDSQRVRDVEDELFGSTRTGQAKVLLSLAPLAPPQWIQKGAPLGQGLGYLAGQGLADTKSERNCTKRGALAAGTRFKVRLLLRASVREEHRKLLCSALQALGLLGGMGARARRGYGSLTLESLVTDKKPTWKAPQDLASLAAEIRALLPEQAGSSEEPPYTALSGNSRIVLLPSRGRERAEDLLERLGRAMLHFRSYGRKEGDARLVGDRPALKLFESDHDLMLGVANRTRSSRSSRSTPEAPRRAVFGLPHNYYFRSVDASVKVNPEGKNRRASPLWLHIHQLPEGSPVAVVSFLPAVFLPGAQPRVALRKGAASIPATLPQELWSPIHEFLAELRQGDASRLWAKFPGSVEVRR